MYLHFVDGCFFDDGPFNDCRSVHYNSLCHFIIQSNSRAVIQSDNHTPEKGPYHGQKFSFFYAEFSRRLGHLTAGADTYDFLFTPQRSTVQSHHEFIVPFLQTESLPAIHTRPDESGNSCLR